MRRRPDLGSRLPADGLTPSAWRLLRAELIEDRAAEDPTTRGLLRGPRPGAAELVAQGRGILSGGRAAARLARSVGLTARVRVPDGGAVRPGTVVLRLEGDLRWILGIERTLLNAIMHLSGVATTTAAAVRAVRDAGGGVEVYATRKTLPGLRDLEKAAVVHGGGRPHRRDLSEALLVKGTHLELVPLSEAILRLRRLRGGRRPLEVEVRSLEEARAAIRAGADAILIDNAGAAGARRILAALEREGLRRKVWVELSGGITLRTVAGYARSGADAVSLGAITHSAPAVPFHLRLVGRAGVPPA